MKRLYLSILFSAASFFVFSQHSSIAYKKLADSLFVHHNYQSAAFYYEKAIKKSTEPGVIMVQMAKSYSNMNKPTEAAHWFEEARNHHAHLSDAEMYLYIRALLSLQKREQAEDELSTLLNDDPNDIFAKQTLDDLRNYQKYYSDSISTSVTGLPFNTPVAEFGPAFYKEGIVFSFAQPDHFLKKKYHYDNTHFLTLYYSATTNGALQKPVLFDKSLDSDFHDGPASFYADGEKMIINRNEQHKDPKNKNATYWYLALYDAERTVEKNEWKLSVLPFNEPPYSMAHPAISPDGNILYFSSDKPGGYGGTDIYKAERKNGIWSKPFNVGPAINTFGDESFPFFINDKLYFASNGHGGLGGLDILKSEQTKNGFSTPINMGYPINSNFDDFALITYSDEETGYFSSSRSGNDDLYSFKKKPETINMIAHIFDGATKESLSEATVQLITDMGSDLSLTSDSEGLIKFELPKKANYVLIGSKNDKSGMQSGVALTEEDHLHITHPLPAFGDTTRIPCVGLIKNESGISQNSSQITVTDETTGKKIVYDQSHPMVSFLGEKGHSYRVEVQNQKGDTTVHKLTIEADAKTSKTWTMILKDLHDEMTLAARTIKAEDQAIMPNTGINIITFTEGDKQLLTGNDGVIEFGLPEGTAYLIVANKDGLTGMHSGVAEKGNDKTSIIHPVSMVASSALLVPVMTLITDSTGLILNDANVIVTDQSTGEKIPVQVKDGVASFFGEKEKEYIISVDHNKYQPASQHLRIPSTSTGAEKLSISLREKKQTGLARFVMSARVFKTDDNGALSDADIKIANFTSPDIDLVADKDGIVDYSLPKGTPYVLIGNKDGYTGMLASTADDGMDKVSIVHPVPATSDAGKHLPVMALVMNKQGSTLENTNVTVLEKSTGKSIPVNNHHGVVSFLGEKGKDHILTVTHKDFKPASALVTIPSSSMDIKKISIILDDNLMISKFHDRNAHTLPIAASVTNMHGQSIPDASVTIVEKYTNESVPSDFTNGEINFNGENGKEYIVTLQHKNYQSVSEAISIPQEAVTVEKTVFSLQEKKSPPVVPKNMLSVVADIKTKDGAFLNTAMVTVTDDKTGKKVPATFNDGQLNFNGQKGKEYTVSVAHDDFQPSQKKISIPLQAKQIDKVNISLEKKPTHESLPVVATIADVNGQPLLEALITVTDKETGKQVPAQFNEGTITFEGGKGKEYSITIDHKGYNSAIEKLNIPAQAIEVDKLNIVLTKKSENTITVTATVADANGNILNDATVTVTEKETGKQIQAQVTDGVLTFTGEKGKEYTVAVNNKDYEPASKQIVIPAQATDVDKLNIVLTKKSENAIPVTATVADANGNILNDATVTVTDKETGKEIQAQITDGVLTFTGEKGKEYTIDVNNKDYEPASKQILIPAQATDVNKLNIVLTKKSENTIPVTATLADANGNILKDAAVTVTEKETGKQIQAQVTDGVLTFVGEKGKEYTIAVKSKGYEPASKNFIIPAQAKEREKIAIVLTKKEEESIPITTNIVDQKGNSLSDASVTVIDKESGNQIPMKLSADGKLTFDGVKGKDYTILVKHKDYQPAAAQFKVPMSNAAASTNVSMIERKIVQPSTILAARVFKADINEPLSNADVKITSFTEPDIDLHTNENGVVEFILPQTTAYILIANNDNYTGLHSGIADVGSDKTTIIHQVPAYKDPNRKIPVIGVATDENGTILTDVQIIVVNRTNGESIKTSIDNGFITFYGEKGADYKIEASAPSFDTQVSNITIDPNDPNAYKLVINLVSSKKSLATDSHIIVINNNDATSRYYVTTTTSHYEIVEHDGILYLESESEKISLGKGGLNNIKSKTDSLLSAWGLSSTEIINIGTIYFDHNKAQLDDEDKKELEKIKNVMSLYPSLKLNIGAHADDRGSDHYNMNLSRKRAKAVVQYLAKGNVDKSRVLEGYYGETLPAIPCVTIECTEEERQKNRRASFAFGSVPLPREKAPVISKAVKATEVKVTKESRDEYAEKIALYGDRQRDSLSFKISIGAYRYNSTLKFNELKDLGTVEIIAEDGITYYYLSEYKTLKEMENIRQLVIKRGVKDASFIILYQGNKIPFSTFLSLTDPTNK